MSDGVKVHRNGHILEVTLERGKVNGVKQNGVAAKANGTNARRKSEEERAMLLVKSENDANSSSVGSSSKALLVKSNSEEEQKQPTKVSLPTDCKEAFTVKL